MSFDGSIPAGFKQTEIGPIPEDWEVREFDRALSVANGQVDPRREPFASMILIAPDHIQEGTGRLLQRHAAKSLGARSGKYLVRPGEIVYSKIRPYLRKAFFSDFEGLCSADMYPLSPLDGVYGEFAFHLILGHRFSSFAETVSARSGIPKVNRTELSEFRLPLPPLPEQRAIAEALSDVDGLIVELETLVAKKRDLKQAAAQTLLTGETRLPGFTGEWEKVTIGDLFKFKNGLNKAKKYFGYGSPIVNYMDVFTHAGIERQHIEGKVDVTADEIRAYDVRPGDVLFTRTSETVNEIGIAAAVLDCSEDTIFSGFVLRARPVSDRMCNEFKKYCFAAKQVRDQIVSKATYTTRALTNGTQLSQVSIAVPGTQEQAAIAAVLSDMDAEIEALEAKLAKTRDLKTGMMQDLLTGRIRLTGTGKRRAA